MKGEDLKALGYCRTSNKYRIVSRIDRPDWKEYMARKHTPWDHEQGMRWVECLGAEAEDYYRRVHSKDKLKGIPDKEFKKIPPSNHTTTGYVEGVAWEHI